MNAPQTFTLPLAPSLNRYWRHANGRTFVSEEARAYKQQAGILAQQQGVTPLDGGVCVRLDVYAERANGDLDNFVKVTLDALNGIAYQDDGQIVELHCRRFMAAKTEHGKREGYMRVTVEASQL